MNRKAWVATSIVLALAVFVVFAFWGREGGKQTIRIGAVLPMTGSASGYGKWMQRGIELAVEDVNRLGGINGKRLEVLVEDSKSDNRVAVDAANKLISIDKIRVIETTLTGVTRSIIPVTERNRVILFTSATAPGLTDEGKYVFRNATNIANEVDAMVNACKNKLNLSKVALIYINNPVGIWINQQFVQRFEAVGGSVPVSESFQPDAVDFRTQIERVKRAGPDAVYILGYQQSGLIMKQARELGLKCQFLGVTDFELPDVLRIAGQAAEGAIYTKASFDPMSGSGEVATYVARYRQQYGEEPEVYGATMYDATRIIGLALARAGSNQDAFREFVLTLKEYPGVSGSTTFLPNGDVSKPVELKTIVNGKSSKLTE